MSSGSIRGTHTFAHTNKHTLFPGKDSVSCPQWRMKKHSARVAPLSSYSTQVLTCPISEGKLSESGRLKTLFFLNCAMFVCISVCVCVCVRSHKMGRKVLKVTLFLRAALFNYRLFSALLETGLPCSFVLFCFCPVLNGCLHHPFSRFGPDSSSNRAASSQPRGASSDLIQKTNQKKSLESIWAVGDCKHVGPRATYWIERWLIHQCHQCAPSVAGIKH